MRRGIGTKNFYSGPSSTVYPQCSVKRGLEQQLLHTWSPHRIRSRTATCRISIHDSFLQSMRSRVYREASSSAYLQRKPDSLGSSTLEKPTIIGEACKPELTEQSGPGKVKNMYNTSPLSSCNQKWFANFLPDDSRLPPSPAIHRFSDSKLEQLVFTHRSTQNDNPFFSPSMPADSMVAWNNEQLEFLGDGVLKALTADLLNDLFPTAGEGELTALKDALINNNFYAYVARRLELHKRLRYRLDGPPSDRILAGLFEAYIGGVYRDLGVEKYHVLRQWFQELFEPFAWQYKSYLDHWKSAQEVPRSRSLTPVGMSAPYGGSPSGGSSFSDGIHGYSSTPPRSGQFPPNSSSSSYIAGMASIQRSESTVELKELADKTHRRPPEYIYESNGQKGDSILWNAIVRMDGRQIANAWAKTKKEAQHKASKKALDMLRGRHVSPD